MSRTLSFSRPPLAPKNLTTDSAPEAVEGTTLLPCVREGKPDTRNAIVFSEIDYAFHSDVRDILGQLVDKCRGYMAFDSRWKYNLWEGFESQLFDLHNDPNEHEDLASNSA
ncbi:hypothetical protein [Sulfitobacter mediterraneus]|uniref:hypothetical protein n=1 Tax=Sulfitobacter mediterraneus TaxID=83219 RepID=UPI0021A65DD5|nr:hypothetical protein [Sulfitobacter mediterraneus]UWR13331.1 hypothetical protein K3753_19400 [Sulfitobacter mediterraneus]